MSVTQIYAKMLKHLTLLQILDIVLHLSKVVPLRSHVKLMSKMLNFECSTRITRIGTVILQNVFDFWGIAQAYFSGVQYLLQFADVVQLLSLL